MKRIAIDMDEVVADTMAHCLALYNAEFQLDLKPKDLLGHRIFEVIDASHVARSRELFYREDFFFDIPVMPGSQEVIRDLRADYEVFITTAAMEVPSSFAGKFRWLQKHFPFIPTSHIVFCGDKSILDADYMIDDNVRHFERFWGEGILYTAPHNVTETRFRRVDSWDNVRAMFLGAANFKRQDRDRNHASRLARSSHR
jgi:5'(3')-deoxyribonucleotidase